MNHNKLLFGLFVFLMTIPFSVVGQDTLTVDKKRIDEIVKVEIKKMEAKYKDGYKTGRVTWTFPEKVKKDKLITVEIKLDGERSCTMTTIR
jgi:hypothetical protein